MHYTKSDVIITSMDHDYSHGKRCENCLLIKPFSAFKPYPTTPDKMTRFCADCADIINLCNARRRKMGAWSERPKVNPWRERNREKIRAYNRRRYQQQKLFKHIFG